MTKKSRVLAFQKVVKTSTCNFEKQVAGGIAYTRSKFAVTQALKLSPIK